MKEENILVSVLLGLILLALITTGLFINQTHIVNDIINTNSTNLPLDASTEALEIIDYEHHEIHAGSHYNYCDCQTGLANNDVIEFVVNTTNSTKEAHLTFEAYSSLGITIDLYENASGVVGGTPIIPRNNNRNSNKTSVVLAVKDPTSIASDGTKASCYLAGAGREAGATSRNREFILKTNTLYLVRITSNANSNDVSWCFDWYEHTPKG